MLSNYIKIALRYLVKNKTYSLINILGLAIGITASAIVLLFVSHEYSYDKFHKNANTIFQVTAEVKWGEQEVNITALSSQFGPVTTGSSPDVVNFARIRNLSSSHKVVQSDARHRFFEERFLFSDTSFFSVFSFELVRGNRAALARPNTVVITEEMEKKYFGNADAIGKILTYDTDYTFEVVGIAKKAPSHSSIQFDFIASFSSLGTIASEKNQYLNDKVALGAYETYLQLNSKESVGKVEAVIAKLKSQSVDEKYLLKPITEKHYAKNLTIFISVALVILALALINYINLTTARATIRGKEVGIRKTIGAQRSALSVQFYLESALMTLIAFALAIAMIQFISPWLPSILQQDIDHAFLRSPVFISIVTLLLLTCIVLSGSYPALALSRFKPVDVLKGKLSAGTQGAWMRKGFTVFQFAASIALVICSLVVRHQLQYMRTKDVGMDKEQVMVIPFERDLQKDYYALKNEIRNESGVKSVAAATVPLFTSGTGAYFTQTPKTHEDVLICVISADKSFFNTLDIRWAKKNNDSILVGDYIINEAALDELKITKDDLGVALNLGKDTAKLEAIVKDFNFASLEQKIPGLVIAVEHDTASFQNGSFYVRLDPKASIRESVARIKQIYESHQPNTPFHYYFLDDAFDQLYKSEERLLTLFTAFTAIAIFIACLGLFGLVTFTTERRMKEIGIRKILGASVQNILTLLSKEFVVLLMVSLLIAAPFAWWAMQGWLTKFAYHTDIPLVFLFIAGISALVLALATIGFQATRAAIRNPVESLKNE